jgi:hypothetical protein
LPAFRRRPVEAVRVDVNAVVEGVSDLIRRTLGGRIDVETVQPVIARCNVAIVPQPRTRQIGQGRG